MTLVYGSAVLATAEPIEKKPLFHAYPGSLAFSIATRGCDFHCRHCQNWQISQADREGLRPVAVHLSPEAVVAEALSSGARSVAYTFVEPTVFIEYLLDTARLTHRAGLANLMVTNGYQTPEALDLLAPVVDAANVDLKSFSDSFYRKVCGARLAPVLEALLGMRRRGIWLEVTTLVIPGLNDGPAELEQLTAWIVAELGPETPWHVSRFYPAFRMGYLPPTPFATMQMAGEIGRAQGLRHVYLGNVPGLPDRTCCAGCGALLIERSGYAMLSNRLRSGRCPACDRPLAGVGLDEAATDETAGRSGA